MKLNSLHSGSTKLTDISSLPTINYFHHFYVKILILKQR